jgi:hypothetical protein
MKKIIRCFIFFAVTLVYSQNKTNTVPVFSNCETTTEVELTNCFYTQLQGFVYENFQVPENLKQSNFKGVVDVLFEVDSTGTFKPLYVNSEIPDLIAESNNVFKKLPKVKPVTFNGKRTYATYTIKISIPLQKAPILPVVIEKPAEKLAEKTKNEVVKTPTELDQITYQKNRGTLYKTHLNIPFSHSYYAQFDFEVNKVGNNNHTASKPYNYQEVQKYYDLNKENERLKFNKTGWWGRKLFDENMVELQGEDYWITLNPIVDLQMGKASGNKAVSTFVNTRALQVQGSLGEKLSFSSTIFESQGRFADYFNRYSNSIKPSGGNPAIIPGIGIAKQFKEDAYDFPSAEANISFKPSNAIQLQLGYGRNFIGDGYRSLLLSDAASPYPFFKINTTFWKIKYTNIYAWMKDVRPEVTVEKTYATKFMASHYLSWNISNKLNLGFFESVVWANTNDRGFDINFVNPIVFYRTVEFTSSSRSGNAVLGLTSKYKWNNHLNLYGQFILDEFSLGEVKKQNSSWKNKYGFQLGAKYYNLFKIKDLVLQMEYNYIRPYVYSHSNVLTNYGHNNQSMGHPWGANLRELTTIAYYRKDRYYANVKLTYGIKGLDFDTADNQLNFGGNIYKNYDENRFADSEINLAQGNKVSIGIANLQAGYIVNPVTNLKLFANFTYRRFKATNTTISAFNENTSWFSVGLRTDIFNFYTDY